MADSTTQNTGAGSKTADEALIETLREANLQGDVWDRFAGELARYGLPIVCSWTASLRMFAKCAEKSVDCPGAPHNIQKLSDKKASEMASEVIARALNKFRDQVLRPGQWSPTDRASLNVMFITQCIFQFPNVYRHWQVDTERLRTDDRYDRLEELEFMDGLVVTRNRIEHALEHYLKDLRVKHALIPWGYAKSESGEMLGVTEKAFGLDGGGEEGTTTP